MAIIKRKRKDNGDDNVETRSRIDDLNDTLLELIFTWLSPWKYLAISKCVSKHWYSIISNPDFTRLLKLQSFPFTIFLSNRDGGECLFTEHPYFRKQNFRLDFIPNPRIDVACNNDLFIVYNPICSQKGAEYCFYITNLLTKQYVVVPIPFLHTSNELWRYRVGIAGFVDGVSTVNNSHRNNNYSHGFRMVVIVPRKPNPTVQIYSSETGQWKSYLFDYIDILFMGLRPIITWNNKIHWLCCSAIIIIDPFNIDNVAPRVLNLPTGIGIPSSSVLSVCQNQLRIAQIEQRSDSENQRVKIWEIEDYDNVIDDLGPHNSVKVKLVIDFELKGFDPNRYYKMVCCHPNDPQVLYFYYDCGLFYCNVVEKKCKRVGHGHWYITYPFLHPP